MRDLNKKCEFSTVNSNCFNAELRSKILVFSNLGWKKKGLFRYFKSYISFNIILSFNNSRYNFLFCFSHNQETKELKEKVMKVTKPS